MAAALFAAPQARLPATVAASLALHAGALAFWLHTASRGPETVSRVISDVDILVAPERRAAAESAAPKPVTMKDFLKLALPSIPKTAAPMEVRAPSERRAPLEVPRERIQDRGRIQEPSRLDMALDKRRVEMAKVDAPLGERRARALSAGPKLEEVGSRRAPRKVIEMAALAEERSAAPRPMGLSALAAEPERRRPQSAALLPQEAQPETRGSLSKMADMLTSEPIALGPREAPAPRLAKIEPAAAAPSPVRAAPQQAPAKGVTIEGPLSNRKVAAHSLPSFPQWLRDAGVVEADVAIRFSVDPSGAVLEGMKVERTSGFGRLDRLAMEHLRLWRFAPLSGEPRNEWGVITFRFVLE